MDKNTLLGMILMGMVLFGFMMFTEGNKQNRDALVEETAQAQAEKAEKEQSLRIDTITAAEAAAVPAIMRQIGTERADSLAPAEYRYRTDKVNLLYDGAAVTGTVQAVDTVLTYAAVAGAQFGDDLSPANRRAAIEYLRSALADADRYRGFARYLSGEDRTVTLKNDLLELEIASKGGRISRATLQKYFTYLPNKQNEKQIDTAKVEICRPEDASYSFVLTSATNRFDTADFYFTPEQVNDSTVVMKLDLGDGASWALRYTLAPDSYVVRMEVVQSGMQKIIPPSVATADFVWAQKLARNERGRTFEERAVLQVPGRLSRRPCHAGRQAEEPRPAPEMDCVQKPVLLHRDDSAHLLHFGRGGYRGPQGDPRLSQGPLGQGHNGIYFHPGGARGHRHLHGSEPLPAPLRTRLAAQSLEG